MFDVDWALIPAASGDARLINGVSLFLKCPGPRGLRGAKRKEARGRGEPALGECLGGGKQKHQRVVFTSGECCFLESPVKCVTALAERTASLCHFQAVLQTAFPVRRGGQQLQKKEVFVKKKEINLSGNGPLS